MSALFIYHQRVDAQGVGKELLSCGSGIAAAYNYDDLEMVKNIYYNLFPRRRNAATEKLKLLCTHAVRRVLGINCIVVSDPLHEDMQRIGKNNVFPKSLSAIGDENIITAAALRTSIRTRARARSVSSKNLFHGETH